jgi:succinate dehydrogenase/fumarate reductase flavoprotein subunit
LPADFADRTLARLNRLNTQTGGSHVNETRLELQRTMQKHCGVFRFKDMLVEGRRQDRRDREGRRAHRDQGQVAGLEYGPRRSAWNSTT